MNRTIATSSTIGGSAVSDLPGGHKGELTPNLLRIMPGHSLRLSQEVDKGKERR